MSCSTQPLWVMRIGFDFDQVEDLCIVPSGDDQQSGYADLVGESCRSRDELQYLIVARGCSNQHNAASNVHKAAVIRVMQRVMCIMQLWDLREAVCWLAQLYSTYG